MYDKTFKHYKSQNDRHNNEGHRLRLNSGK